jgi:HEPN domain-containing protein
MTNKIAIKWLKQALHDLEMAEKNISIEGYDIAAFLAHQSIEKLLKAIIAIQGKKIPKTHYIDELAKQLKLDSDIIDSISDLTIDYTFSRYPDVSDKIPYEEYDITTAKEKVKKAKDIFESLKEFYDTSLEEENREECND